MGHGPARTDVDPHDLLSATHDDTTAASAVVGDILTAQQDLAGGVNDSKFWLDGAALDAISGENAPAGLAYWLDGEAMDSIIAGTVISGLSWRRKSVGGEGEALVVRSGVPTWEALAAVSIGDGVSVYQSASYTALWGALTTVSFSTVLRDDAGYFSTATPTRITVPSAGWYAITGTVAAPYAHFGLLWVMVYVDGVRKLTSHGGMTNVSSGWGGENEPRQVTGLLYLTAGQYLELKTIASRTNFLSTALVGGVDFCNFTIVKVG